MKRGRPPTIRELGQVALAAIQGDANATMWLLHRVNLAGALTQLRRLEGDRRSSTLH